MKKRQDRKRSAKAARSFTGSLYNCVVLGYFAWRLIEMALDFLNAFYFSGDFLLLGPLVVILLMRASEADTGRAPFHVVFGAANLILLIDIPFGTLIGGAGLLSIFNDGRDENPAKV
jgi:hypothetical protein